MAKERCQVSDFAPHPSLILLNTHFEPERLDAIMKSRRILTTGLLLLTLTATVTMNSALFEGRVEEETLLADTVPSPRTLYRITPHGQIVRSNDAGQSWTLVHGPRKRATALAGFNDRVLFVGKEAAGVFKSQNVGLTWEHARNGLGT